jgi:outer membrane protein assembly factor BamB
MGNGPRISLRSSVLLVVVLTLALSACDWPMFRYGPARTGFNPSETRLGIGNVGQLREVWSADLGTGSVAQHASAAVVGRTVYMGGSDGLLHVLDAASGALLWTGVGQPLVGLGPDLSSPSVTAGTVFAGSGTAGQVNAWDAAGTIGCSGTPKTCQPLSSFFANGNFPSSPVDVNGVLYAAATGEFLYAANALNGLEMWRAYIGGTSSSPAVAGGVAYVGARDHRLWAFDAAGSNGCGGVPKSCVPLWTATTGAPVDSSPAVANGVVYVGSSDNKLYAFDASGQTGCTGVPKTCRPLWTATTGAQVACGRQRRGLRRLGPALRVRRRRIDRLLGHAQDVHAPARRPSPDTHSLVADSGQWPRVRRRARQPSARLRVAVEVLERIDLDRSCCATMLGGPDRRTLPCSSRIGAGPSTSTTWSRPEPNTSSSWTLPHRGSAGRKDTNFV